MKSLAASQQMPSLPEKIEKLLVEGDLSRLSTEERVTYYNKVCDSLGLNPLTKPFSYIKLNGKLTLYALKDATEQLRKLHGVSIKIIKAERVDDLFVVVTEATDRNGRTDSATGAVSIGNLKGEAKANAFLKAETKSKRRVTLSICGLGMLDETEAASIPGAEKDVSPQPTLDERRKEMFSKPKPAKKPEVIDERDPPPMNADEDLPDFMPRDDRSAEEVASYVCPVGKTYKGKKLKDIPPKELAEYVIGLQNQAKEQGKTLPGEWKTLVDTASEYLAMLGY